jgi:hypothetical protein
MTEFFNLQCDPEMDIAVYVAKGEIIFSDINTELRRRVSLDIPTGLLRGQILTTVGPEYKELSNVWESLDDNKRTKTSLLERMCRIKKKLFQTLPASGIETKTSAFVPHALTTKSQTLAIKTTLIVPSGSRKEEGEETRSCFHCRKVGHLK